MDRVDPIDRAERDLARGSTAASRRGRWLVEASAGTGKTSVLIDRALAYVRAGERRIKELAVITFTEAAAAELKMRLRAGIGAALAAAEGDDRARWVEALGDLESAPIGTIHAFCVELLRLRPVEAGLDPNFSVADELTRKLLFAEVWDEWLRAGDIPDEAFEAALDLGFDGEAELRQAAERLAEIEPEALPKPWFKEADLLVGWERAYALAQSGLRACDPKGSLSGKFQSVLKTMDEWRALPTRQWQRKLIARELKISTQAGKKEFEQRAIQARGEINELLALLRERLVHLRLCEFSAWLATAGTAYRERAARSGRVDFDEQLRRARKLLHDVPAVRAEFRRRYPVVMVDEFQDTDRLQTEIVLMLAEPGDDKGGHEAPRSLFLVGDPKQSIYRFRGADLESYNRLVLAEVPEERRLTLRQSFRPLPALAEAVNQAMAKVMAPPAGQVLAAYETAYRDLAAVEPRVPPRGGGIVDLQLAPFDASRTSNARAAEAEALARFAFAAVDDRQVEVRDRASSGDAGVRPARYGDVALLLSKMTELQAYEEAFNRSGVPFRVLGGRHYYRRDEVHALLEILRALADPGDAGAVVAALRGPAFGVSDAELLAYSLAGGRPRLDGVWVARAERIAESPDPAAAARCGEALHALVDLRDAVIALPLADLVAEVIERMGLLPYFALQHRGEQRVANLHKAIDVARRIEAAGRRDLQSFMRWMAGLLEEEPEESDSPYLEGEGDAVRVTTVHRAKGLEYPIVMLGGIVGGTAPDVGLRVLRREDGGIELRIPGKRGTSGWRSAQDLEDARQVAEEKRLLYVALTRARDVLVLPSLPPALLPGLAKSYSPLFRHLNSAALAESGAGMHVRSVAAVDLPAPPPVEGPHRISLRSVLEGDGSTLGASRTAWQDRERATVVGGFVRPSGATEEARSELPAAALAARERARRIGNAAHAGIAARLRGRPAATSLGFSDDEQRRLGELIANFDKSLLAARLRAAAGDREPLIEAPLAVRLEDGTLLDGQVDLAFVENDAWILVDYKYGRPQARDAARLETYQRQLRAYATALTAASGLAVKEAWLFFLAEGEAQEVAMAP